MKRFDDLYMNSKDLLDGILGSSLQTLDERFKEEYAEKNSEVLASLIEAQSRIISAMILKEKE